jgi:hypothetical protein
VNTERWIMIFSLCAAIYLLIKFVPLQKIRDAIILFLSLQMLTWPLGLIAVEMKWIEYPVQLLPNINQTNKSSLWFEFFFFPVLSIVFSLQYPRNNNKLLIFKHFLLFTGLFTVLEVVIERYTDLVQYNKWKWYWSFFSIWIVLFINHRYYIWFKKGLVEVSSHE